MNSKTIQNRVFTTGYEGRDIDEFIQYLNEHNVQRIVDVREIPISRKKGFSKSKLREKLAESGIDYVHIKRLGSPKPLRRKLYADGDFEYFFDRFEKYLESCSDELEQLYEIVNEKLSCLLCF